MGVECVLVSAVASLGLVSAVFLGVSDFLAARAVRLAGTIASGFVVSGMAAIVAVAIAVPFLPHPGEIVGMPGLAALGAGGLIAVGNFTFYRGLRVGQVSIMSSISGTYPVVTVVVAVLLLRAPCPPRQLGGILLTVLGIVIASGVRLSAGQRWHHVAGPLFALLSSGLWGIGNLLIAVSVPQLGWQGVLAAETLVSTVFFGFVTVLSSWRDPDREILAPVLALVRSPHAIGCAATLLLGTAALDIAVIGGARAPESLVAITLSACYPVIAVVLAMVRLRERVNWWQLAGAGAGLCGVVVTLT